MTSGKPAESAERSRALSALAARYIPITVWLPAYSRAWLRPDLLAAVTSWGVMVPVALAYAGLAGVPPELGLVTAFTALAAYAVFGTSRHLKVTVSSTMAIMSASVVADLAGGDPALFVEYTAALALTVGVILVVAGVAKLGFISDFLTKSVVTGFIIGLAITIIVGQIPKILGVPGLSGSLPEQVVQLVGYVPDTNPYTLAVGLSALVLILVLRRISRKIPGPLIALVLGIVAVSVLDLEAYGVTTVGEVATGLPLPSLPGVPVTAIPYLALGAAGIVFLAVGESVGAGRAYAARHRYEIDPDQELLALGAANLSSGLFGGFTTDASLSQTATAESAGAKSQLSSLVTAALILATAVLLAPLFQNLPNAVLGAIVIAAVLGLIDVAEMRRYWAWRRTDFMIATAAMVGVLLTTVLTGMLLAVLLSVAFVLYNASRPYVAALGRMPGHRGTFGDLSRHPEAELVPGLVIVRLDAPLYFFNANVAKAQILKLVGDQRPEPRGVLIDLAASADLDVTSADMLVDLVAALNERSIEVLLAQVKGSVRDRLRKTGLMAAIGEDRVYLSIGSAATDFQRRWPGEGGAAAGDGRSSPPVPSGSTGGDSLP
ncbi:MAG: sulfate permease, SulP family [Chloroflexota bacterium]|nr:sulfate permease, SulP family [Chloroflexota bacterium]